MCHGFRLHVWNLAKILIPYLPAPSFRPWCSFHAMGRGVAWCCWVWCSNLGRKFHGFDSVLFELWLREFSEKVPPTKNLVTKISWMLLGEGPMIFLGSMVKCWKNAALWSYLGCSWSRGLLMARCPFCYSSLLRRPVGSQAGKSRVDCLIAHSDPPVNLFEDATLRSTG